MRNPWPAFLRILCAGAFLLITGIAAGADPAVIGSVPRIVAVGDVHGDLDQFLQILRDAEVIDKRNRWIGGKTHLVQLGDVPDRGPDTLEIIELLMRLEKDARRRKGAVHCLIGNHEAMNTYGDLRYVHPGEFAAFVSKNSKRYQQAHYESGVDWIKANTPEEEWPQFDDAHRQAWYEKYPLGFLEHAQAWQPEGRIWKWMINHNAVLKIGDTLFLHGGLGPRHAGSTVDEINEAVRTALGDVATIQESIVRDEDGPLWYRGLAQHPESTENAHLEALLSQYQVTRIVMGHTPSPGAIVPRFGGRAILADVGLSRHYTGGRACLIIENGVAFALHRGTKIKLPTGGSDEVIAYLEEVAALDPQPSPLQRMISRLKNPPVEEPATVDAPATSTEPVGAY